MKCVVVIPIYKKELSLDEIKNVSTYISVLKDEDIVFICPSSLDKSFYQETFASIGFREFPDKYFTGTKSYNRLMLNEAFYDEFIDYDYMLIAQTDACLWGKENRLSYFMNKGYDYIGAPWIPERRIYEWVVRKKEGFPGFRIECCKKKNHGINMGNGGFCLRKIDKCKMLIHEYRFRKLYWFIKRNEDIFFGVFGRENKSGFILSDVETGLEFAREYSLKEAADSGSVPFGVHGWKKEFQSFDEMENFLKDKGVW